MFQNLNFGKTQREQAKETTKRRAEALLFACGVLSVWLKPIRLLHAVDKALDRGYGLVHHCLLFCVQFEFENLLNTVLA